MSILIDKVRVYNYRSLHKCEIELSPVTLLIGANNSGKTSFLRALNLALGVGSRRIVREDFYISRNEKTETEKEILIDVRVIPVNEDNNRVDSFADAWREKQFGELISIDENDKEFFAFRTKVTYDIMKGDYVTKRYKVKDWSDVPDWEQQKHSEELKQFFEGFPLFFIDAQRDIIQDLRDRNSYFGRLVSKIKIDSALIQEIEEKIKVINESIVANSEELDFLKQELEKLRSTIGTSSAIEINPVNKKMRDINRGINVNLQDSESESFPLDYHGMGTRSWASLLTFGAFISWQYKKCEEDNSPYHTLLALEEPEAHLHPHAQRTLYKQLSEMKGQKIISTHSPFIASQCELDELRHFQKSKDSTCVSALKMANLDDDGVRKVKREVLNTRGELLFASAVVLFEGETEEQSLPFFAEKHWGKHPYELGLSFVGVGGQNYRPFLELINSFNLQGFIFSDGEDTTIKSVKKHVTTILHEKSEDFIRSNTIIIPGNFNFEQYLVNQGYSDKVKEAIEAIEGEGYVDSYKEKNDGNTKRREKTKDVCSQCKQNIYVDIARDYSEPEGYQRVLIDIIEGAKTRYAAKVAEVIADKEIPPVILELFNKIDLVVRTEKKNAA